METLKSLWNEYRPKTSTDSLAMGITFTALPVGYLHAVLWVTPTLYPKGGDDPLGNQYWNIVHTIAMTYLFIIILVDLYRLLTTNTAYGGLTLPSIPQSGWASCPYCQHSAPPRTHHCRTCAKCILRRDHHCFFIGRCIGYYNHKYFLLLLLHAMTGAIYGVIMSFKLLFLLNGGFSWALLGTAIFPILLWMLQLVPINPFILMATGGAMLFTVMCGGLLLLHLRNLYMGQTYWEANQKIQRDRGLLHNLRDIMGTRWWLLCLCPLFPSPQLGDGMHYGNYREGRPSTAAGGKPTTTNDRSNNNGGGGGGGGKKVRKMA